MQSIQIMIVAICAATMVQAQTITDPELSISFAIPEGFHKVEQSPELPPQSKHTYSNYNPNNPDVTILISIDGLGGVLPQVRNQQLLGASESEDGFPVKWKHLWLQAARAPDNPEDNDLPLVLFQVLLPVDPEAVYVRMLGPQRVEPEMRHLFEEVVASIQGETKWTTTPESGDDGVVD